MTYKDTDPNFKVPALQNDSSRADIALAINRLTAKVDALDSTMRLNTIYCPMPGVKCPAMDMSETAMLGVIEDRKARARDVRVISALGACAVLVAAVIGTVGAAVFQGQAKAAIREQVPMIVEHEVAKRSKSTEAISRNSAREGGLEALREFRREQQIPPLIDGR